MVTMVVMTIGLLGLAGLQATALRSNSSATFRTQAILYANDMAERIKANPTAVANNDFDVSSATIDCSALPVPYCEGYYNEDSSEAVTAANCSASQLASFDINTWYCGIARSTGTPTNRGAGLSTQLPQTSATISCTDSDVTDADLCSPNSTHTITVTWRTLKGRGTNFVDTGECLNDDDAATDCQSITLVIQP